MALKKVKGNIERMFDKNLTDLVRGIRNNKENEVKVSWYFTIFPSFTSHTHNYNPLQAKYISQCMEDIKQELRQDNLSVKSNAIAKLTYVSSHNSHKVINWTFIQFITFSEIVTICVLSIH